MSDELKHIGVVRKSGRYPWGSGENPHQHSKSFLSEVAALEAKGLSPVEVAAGMGMTTKELRAQRAIAKNIVKKDQIATAVKLKAKDMSTVAIGEQMGLNESSVRNLLKESTMDKADKLMATADMLKDQIADGSYLDIGGGTGANLGISDTALDQAVEVLKAQGYGVHKFDVPQAGTVHNTKMKVLVPPDTAYIDVVRNPDKVKTVAVYSEDKGKTFRTIKPPVAIDPKRVAVRYKEDGGAEKDGTIELRRGVDDISLGTKNYAQVRIKVGEDSYLKGMALYRDDLPDGVDIVFNTNKSDTGNKFDAMKPIKRNKETGVEDPDMPFGSIVRQKTYVDKNGKTRQSVLNIVGTPKPDSEEVTSGEEGGWSTWSKNLSSQMLSKQTPALARQQLKLAGDIRQAEYDEIMELTNPVVRKKLLESFADGADSSAVHLKAAGLPRTANHVILPINSLKDNEIFAPQYKDGESVVLIRHPHGGIFEIPELRVNNKNQEARRIIPNARDAVGINSRVAERLSGADFDGDTVLVIPNASKGPNRVQTRPELESLKGFDTKQYKLPASAPKMSSVAKQQQMGNISNLITDMTIKEASWSEIGKAVKHSMVVIDAEKHHLDYKQSAKDNDIAALKKKYQSRPDGTAGGSSTLISRAKSEVRVPLRKPRPAKDGGPIDKATGKKVYVDDPKGTFVNKEGKTIQRTTKVTKMALADDAKTLMSSNGGTVIEKVYADHANRMKALANTARKSALEAEPTPYNPAAKKAYAPQVTALKAKLNEAQKNAPRERQAQLIANSIIRLKQQDNPDMGKDELKKVKALAISESRARVGAKKPMIDITDSEWAAIQAGAITPNMLRNVLDNTNLDRIKELATPRQATVMVPAKVRRAQIMLNNGHTPSEIAEQLGVPVSTLMSSLTT